MLWTILLALTLFSLIGGLVAWLGRATTSVVATYTEVKEDVESGKRERAIAETKTATELWAAADMREEERTARESRLPSGHVIRIAGTKVLGSEKLARAYLIAKHGDNIAAYDAWKKAINGRAGELTTLYTEVFAWKKEQKNQAVDVG